MWTILHTYPLDGVDQINDVLDTCFASVTSASKVAIHCTLNMLPGASVFQREMILNIPLTSDLPHILKQQEIIIDVHLQ